MAFLHQKKHLKMIFSYYLQFCRFLCIMTAQAKNPTLNVTPFDIHLPAVPNRIWYEADINYEFGYRGTERILFSNDGLIFVTYDHYATFIEIE
ncbi:MAG: hypothetical protein EGR16_10275 [Clostridiales bacterium]|nr:hypothetical protein [Clostridiales bacterium]